MKRLATPTFPLFVVGVLVVAAHFAPIAKAENVPGQYIVVLKDGTDVSAAAQRARAAGGEVLAEYRHALRGYLAKLSPVALTVLQADSRILFISPDEEVTAGGQTLPTGVDRIEGDRSSTRSGNGRGSVNVNVAVIDSGIDVDHPDLNVVGGVDCTSGKGFDDPHGHGTAVASILAARDNGTHIVGVAPGARLWAVRVLDKHGVANFGNIICGIDWVTGTRTDADPTNDIAVANMSIVSFKTDFVDDGQCGRTVKDAWHLAVCGSVAAGVTYVVGAGNDGLDFEGTLPATYDEVLTTAAVTDLDGRPGGLAPAGGCLPEFTFTDDSAAFFSDFATLVADQAHTIAAPGVCIEAVIPADPDIVFATGTSFASPLVAGTAALCIAAGPCSGLAPPQIIQKLISDAAAYNNANPGYGFTGDPLRPESSRFYGYLIRAALY